MLWRLVFDSNYGSSTGGRCFNEVRVHMVWVCGKIIEMDGEGFPDILDLKLVKALEFFFWHNVWCGDRALKFAFPTYFQIASDKEALVADMMDSSSGSIQ